MVMTAMMTANECAGQCGDEDEDEDDGDEREGDLALSYPLQALLDGTSTLKSRMPLHLSQHKSYHPYNRDNQHRVFQDEQQEAQRQEHQRQASFARRDEARLEALRSGRKAPSSTPATTQEPRPRPSPSPSPARASSSTSRPSSGHSLLRPEDELTPWYTTSKLRNGKDARKSEDQRLEDAYKDSSIKSSNDPLKAMQAFLAQRKAAKILPTTRSSPIATPSDEASDLYEPDAVRAARKRRSRRSSHHRILATSPSRQDRAHARHRRHRPGPSASGRGSSTAEKQTRYKHHQ
ncbi:hypothetical protein PHSY_006658 [Pseudozyma hubeiensis SY62]|uniref:CBF1-interacting co-repressor CIR N-terminal domain-containing protein n=1 Tax=Pseudozyma hubeiensis (strain SY62) TaxID=1305764 RepID=R9PCG4_PSEHS|nr:hypothetical protein PHSY_006658 [Pseudozyma hubeiensis SY62]GAC99061.1 hypothetical protein PHSY_006658 [Pseudozyma hubeiensis SY62]